MIPLSLTAAQPIGNCPSCGGARYANLVHHCSTNAAAAIQPQYPRRLDTSAAAAPLQVMRLLDTTAGAG